MTVFISALGGAAAQFFDSSGNPLTGGLLYSYAAGTTTPQATFTSSAGSTAHTNPIVLDAAGRVSSGEIWLSDGLSYKFVLRDSAGALIGTYDNLTGINSNYLNYTNSQEIQTATSGQTVFTLTTMQYAPGTNSLSVFVDGINQYGPGAQYAYTETNSTTVTFNTGLTAGQKVKFTNSEINGSSYGTATQISYTPPFTSSSATNVSNKLAQTVSVKDFGAVGDGVANDTTAIQTAITQSAGKTLYFPSGTYVVSTQINLVSNITLLGYNATITCATTPTTDLLFGASKTNVVIEGLTFDGGSYTVATNIGLVAFQLCTDVKVLNCRFVNMDRFGLIANGGSRYLFDGNYIKRNTAVNTQNQAILVSTSAGVVTQSTISNNIMLNSALNVSMSASTIANNYISGWRFGGGITTEQDPNCKSLQILNNYCGDSVGTDVNLNVCQGIENWAALSIISGNYCIDNAGSGIDQGGKNSICSNNYCFNNGKTANSPGIVARYGTATYNANYSLFSGNLCYDSNGAGGTQTYGYVEQSALLTGLMVTGNQFATNKTGNVSVLSTTTSYQGPVAYGTQAYGSTTIANGARTTVNITTPGAALGDMVTAAYDKDLQGVTVFGYVNATNATTLILSNNTGGSVTLAAGNFYVQSQKSLISPAY